MFPRLARPLVREQDAAEDQVRERRLGGEPARRLRLDERHPEPLQPQESHDEQRVARGSSGSSVSARRNPSIAAGSCPRSSALTDFTRAKRPERLSEVLIPTEVSDVLDRMAGVPRRMAARL
ncbi:hypothetical protein [Sorangium sp. So ce385]|uniref:hypothetical protein n=1 Tax=Sorangium sp. So ce385 TaxID=3133308 RepID=UPI003F5C6616